MRAGHSDREKEKRSDFPYITLNRLSTTKLPQLNCAHTITCHSPQLTHSLPIYRITNMLLHSPFTLTHAIQFERSGNLLAACCFCRQSFFIWIKFNLIEFNSMKSTRATDLLFNAQNLHLVCWRCTFFLTEQKMKKKTNAKNRCHSAVACEIVDFQCYQCLE